MKLIILVVLNIVFVIGKKDIQCPKYTCETTEAV